MRNVTHRVWGAGLGVVLLAGCGAPTVGEYADELELAYCEWETECHRFASISDCKSARGLDRDRDFAYLIDAVAAGTAEYDGDAALDCLEAIRGRGCWDAEPAAPAVCGDVFRGRIGRNGPCMSSLECVGDAVCGFDPACADECCPGACRVLPDALEKGAACGGSAQCGDGLYCAVDPDTFVATVCTALVKVGGACVFDDACVEEAYCGDDGMCTQWRDRESGESCAERGDRCVAPAECHYVQLEGDEFGAADNVCVTPGHLGAVCDPLDSGSCGRFDTYCEPATSLCTLLPIPGAACSSEGCADYASCQHDGFDEGDQASPGTCVALAGLGDACGEVDGHYVDCLGDLWCDESQKCSFGEPPAEPCPVPESGA